MELRDPYVVFLIVCFCGSIRGEGDGESLLYNSWQSLYVNKENVLFSNLMFLHYFLLNLEYEPAE